MDCKPHTLRDMASGQTAHRPRSHALLRSMLVFCALAWAALGALPARAQHHVPVSLNELVDGSGSVLVGQLLSAQPRWNDNHNLIFTDYRFRIERVLYNGGIGNFEIVLSQAGGTLDGETHRLSSNPQLQVGERYLVFLDPQANQVLCPFLGGDQGVYRIDRDDIAWSLSGQAALPLDELVQRIDGLVQQRGNAAPVFHHAGPPAGVTYPSKTALPLRAPFPPAAGHTGSLTPLVEDAVAAPEPRSPLASGVDDPPAQERGLTAPVLPAWHRFALANRPIVWDEWPHDWWVSPHDQYMMSRWNGIADDLNRISGAELTTWAWGNDRFEMVGFPDNATMIAQFGAGWGATTLAITYSRWNGSGVILESDIAMNPAYCWTLDESRSRDGADSCWGIDATTLHELGHGWGLAHPWETENVWWDSVMNYSPKEFRLPLLHADDTDAARTSYPGATLNTDGLISMYRTSDNANSNEATYSSAFPASLTLYHGGALNLDGIQVENPGTVAWSNPQVDIYLTQNWNTWTDTYYLLRSAHYSVAVNPRATQPLTVNPTTIPATLPTGRYFPTLYLPLTGDQFTRNNTAAGSPTRTVTVRNNVVALAPTTVWQTWSTGHIGPSGSWEFSLPVVAGDTYELSLCSADGGWANFDSVLEVVGVGSNDDYCGLTSRMSFVSATTTTRTVSVRGYSVAAQGDFTLAYRRSPPDLIFRNGFD